LELHIWHHCLSNMYVDLDHIACMYRIVI